MEQGGDGRGAMTRAGLVRGLRAGFGLTLALVPFGLVTGMAADAKGLSLLETLLMGALVFAGTSQLVALELWSDPAPLLGATLACLVINLRLAPMGAALAPVLDRLRGIRLWGSLALLVDNAFALAIAELRAGRRDAGFFLGASLAMWANWVAMSGIGHALGAAVRLPAGHPVFFASLAALVAILALLWRGRAEGGWQAWAAAGAVLLAQARLGSLAVSILVGVGALWGLRAGFG